MHPRSSSIEIQLSGCCEVQVQVQIRALLLVQVQLLGASTSTWCKYIPEADQSKRNLVVNQCCNVVEWLLVSLVHVGGGGLERSVNSFAGFFQRVFLAPTDVQESLSGVDAIADPIGAKSIWIVQVVRIFVV